MKKFVRFLRVEVLPLIIIFILVTAVRSSLADHYHVPTGSMENTLMPGDHVLVDKTEYGLRLPYTKIDLVPMRDPEPGEVVIFDSPMKDELLIKRVVAVEGDEVLLTDGKLFINGIPLGTGPETETELFNDREAFLNLKHGGGPDIPRVRVPEDKLLVLGDHRGDSIDGRYFGFIDKKELYGRAVGVFYRRDEGFVWKAL